MTSRTTPFVLAMVVASTAATAVAQSPAARVRVTQRALQVLCVGDDATRPGTRAWRTPTATPVTLAVTMRNDPRPGVADAEPGLAVIGFTPEPGHRYEVEVRAEATSFSRRVWARGAWTPVVRDRTTETIVSGPAEWVTAPPCAAARPQG